MIWFHAASVGESLSLVELIKRISSSQPDYNFLITTGTITSAKLILSRLPSNAVHQYIPVDTPKAVEKFLDRWRPSLAIWTESEFWPNLISFTSARDIPMILINARISEKSYRRWRFFKKSLKNDIENGGTLRTKKAALSFYDKNGVSLITDIAQLTSSYDAVTYANILSKQILNNESVTGSSDVDRLYQNTFTQSYDTNITIESGSATLISDLITIVADTIYDPITKPQEKIEFVSNYPIPRGDSLSPVVAGKLVLSFVGGSFVPIGGHNPFEPAALGSAILHGPYVENFKEIYNRLNVAGAAVKIEEASELGVKLIETLSPENAAKLAQSAWEVSSNGAEITDRAIKLIYENLSLGDL